MSGNRKSEKWLIHFSGDDWWQSNPHSRHHITRQFQRAGYRILWVNPMGLRFPSLKKKGFMRKIFNKFKSLLKMLKKDNNGYFIFTFFFLPVFKRGLIERLNSSLIYMQFRVVLRLLGIKDAVAFVTLPTFASLVRKGKHDELFSKTIYYYSDQYDKYREIRDPEPILAWDKMLQIDSDAIYCASQAIYDVISDDIKASKIVRVIDHQVDFDMFDYKNIKPDDLDIEKPIIGYFGSLTDSNDWAMIEYAAKTKPEWNFVFVGKKLISLPELEQLPNVHFLGFIPYEELPSIAVNFSVGIMFWKMTDWIEACSPLKLKEYLAMGLPVVSVPIREVVTQYQDYVEVAADGPELVSAVTEVLSKDVREKHRAYAQRYSWGTVVEEIMDECKLS